MEGEARSSTGGGGDGGGERGGGGAGPAPAAAIIDAVSIEELKDQIEESYFKVRHYRVFAFYLVFLACLISLLTSNSRVHMLTDDASYYIMESSLKVCEHKKFTTIAVVEDFYSWLRHAAHSLYASGARPMSQNVPIGFATVRQLRSKPVDCVAPSIALPDNTTAAFKRTGYRCRVDGENDVAPYGDPSQPWEAGGTSLLAKGVSDRSFLVSGELYAMDDAESEFAVPFYYNTSWYKNPSTSTATSAAGATPPTTSIIIEEDPPLVGDLSAALREISRMEQYHWIDEQTRIISVDVLFYSKAVDRYTRVSLIVEQPKSGSLVVSNHGETFTVMALGNLKANFLFFVDLVLFGYILALTADMVHFSRTKYLIHRTFGSMFGVWEVLNLSLIVMLWIALIVRMELWRVTRHIAVDMYAGMKTDKAMNLMVSRLFLMGKHFELSFNVLALSLLPGSMKTLMYFQSVRGLSVISHTIKSSIVDISGLAFISFTLFCLFSAVSTILFGSYALEFATVTNSFSTLTRMIVAADVVFDFERLMDDSPRVTVIFFALCFFLLWLVVLNLMVGIIVTAFAAAQQNQISNENLETLTHVFSKYFLLQGDFFKEDIRLKPQYGNRRMSSSVACCSAALRTQMSLGNRYRRLVTWQEERFGAVIRLRDLMELGREEVPLLELGKILPEMAEEHRMYFYRLVRSMELSSKQTRSQVEENDEELAYKLVELQRHLQELLALQTGEETTRRGGGDGNNDDEDSRSQSLSHAGSSTSLLLGTARGRGRGLARTGVADGSHNDSSDGASVLISSRHGNELDSPLLSPMAVAPNTSGSPAGAAAVLMRQRSSSRLGTGGPPRLLHGRSQPDPGGMMGQSLTSPLLMSDNIATPTSTGTATGRGGGGGFVGRPRNRRVRALSRFQT